MKFSYRVRGNYLLATFLVQKVFLITLVDLFGVGKGVSMGLDKTITTTMLKKMKNDGEKIVMLTAYDYPSALLAEQAGVEVILVGDSLGNVILGHGTTLPVTINDMVYHTKAVTRAVKNALVVADMPFLSYHGSWDKTLLNAGSLMQDGNASAVKLEGGREVAEIISKLTQAGIPVMGHIGLTPQSVHQMGGFKVQGKDAKAAKRLIEDAHILEAAGCFSIVLEGIPGPLAKIITDEVSIPTIGIGAGVHCDGQVLVFHDMLGYGGEKHPKFVKQYAAIGDLMKDAIRNYGKEVKESNFPTDAHTYTMNDEILSTLYGDGSDT